MKAISRRKLVAVLCILSVISMTSAAAVMTIFGTFDVNGTGDLPLVLFQQGSDGIATITGGGTGATVAITYIANWNWTATGALDIRNIDSAPHSVTISYMASSGYMTELDKMYCYFNGTLFFSYYNDAVQKSGETWASLPAGQRLVIMITSLGDTTAVEGHTFSITFKLSYT
jgi:hypothetical protein